jgi:hypothetical protein
MVEKVQKFRESFVLPSGIKALDNRFGIEGWEYARIPSEAQHSDTYMRRHGVLCRMAVRGLSLYGVDHAGRKSQRRVSVEADCFIGRTAEQPDRFLTGVRP